MLKGGAGARDEEGAELLEVALDAVVGESPHAVAQVVMHSRRLGTPEVGERDPLVEELRAEEPAFSRKRNRMRSLTPLVPRGLRCPSAHLSSR